MIARQCIVSAFLLTMCVGGMEGCSSSMNPPNPKYGPGGAVFFLDSTFIHCSSATFGGGFEIQASEIYPDGETSYFFTIQIKRDTASKQFPLSFIIDTSRNNSVSVSHEFVKQYLTTMDYVSDSGEITIMSDPDSLSGWLSVRLRASDSSIHHLSGVFVATPPKMN